MRRFFFIVIIVLLLALLFAFHVNAQALTPAAKSSSQTVKASVGKYYLSVSGYISPFASVVISTGSFILDSTVADENGNFSFKNILINEGFSQFCLLAVDVKRIGESYTCFNIPPAKSSVEKKNIFLPPTLGLSGRSLLPGSSVFASGYTMPGGRVNLRIADGIFIDTVADAQGFYKVEIKNLRAGKYLLFANATYKGRISEKPSKSQELISLSLLDLIRQNSGKIILIVLLVLLIIILLIILISKRVRERIKEILRNRGFIREKKKKKPLHHEWFLGF